MAEVVVCSDKAIKHYFLMRLHQLRPHGSFARVANQITEAGGKNLMFNDVL